MKKLTDNSILELLDFITNNRNDNSFRGYKLILNKLLEYTIPFPTSTLSKGSILFRARVHKKNEDYYRFIRELGHRVDNDRIETFGRANEPTQSIFYCSDNYDVAFFETSMIARHNLALPVEIITIGIWEVKEDIRVACFTADKNTGGLNRTIDGLQNDFENLFKILFQRNSNIFLKIIELFSLEFTRDAQNDAYNYMISCAISNYIYSVKAIYKKDNSFFRPKGILYPSFMHVTEGVNFALRPEIIEKNIIVLKQAVRKSMKRIDETTFKDILVEQSKFVDYYSGEILWK